LYFDNPVVPTTAAPSCFNALTRLVPVVRAETARRLVKAGLQQERVAEHLGVSQAMVSKYLKRVPSLDGVGTNRLVAELADQSVQRALADEEKGSIPAWCPVCDSLSARGFSCALQALPKLHECVRQDRARTPDDGARVLDNLAAAAQIVHEMPLARLVPEVRSNLAMARPDAASLRDVAAFPGRLIEIRGEIREIAPPEFGASTHLADLLLRIRRSQKDVAAILNLRYGDDVRHALKASKLKARILRRTPRELVAAVPAEPALDAAIDAGAFGIEPALYLLGASATDVIQKARRLLAALPTERSK
jgi:XRE family transcriptional regulator, thiamine biosynthesis regulator